jgi:hypothetical protein
VPRRAAVAFATGGLVLGVAPPCTPAELRPLVSIVAPSNPTGYGTTAIRAAYVATPGLGASFSGPYRDGQGPPDPVIAAGPDRLIVMVNDRIALLAKDGTVVDRAIAGHDPKILYDPHSERFFALSLEGSASPSSFLRIEVSKGSAPTTLSMGPGRCDEWWEYRIAAGLDGGVQLNNDWADFPGLGVDRSNLYVTANMIPNGGALPQYAKVWVIAKSALLSGGPAVVFEFGAPPAARLVNPVTGTPNFNVMPSINFDLASEHMLAAPLETAGALGRGTLWTIDEQQGMPVLVSTDLLLPGWTGPIYPPCPQPGGGTNIDTGFFTPTFHAVERGGVLWGAHTAPNAPTAAARTEIHWYAIDPAAASVLQSGHVTDVSNCYFYSAIQPDSVGNVALVMSQVGPDSFASAAYTMRLATDPPGTMRPVSVLRAGEAHYEVVSDGRNRWGDYGGIAADPASDGIWMFHQYASSTDRWSTWVGELQLAAAGPTTTTSTTLPGAVPPRLDCLCAHGLPTEPCSGQAVPPIAGQVLTKACDDARRAAVLTGRKRRRLLRRIEHRLRRARSPVLRRLQRREVSAECSAAVAAILADVIEEIFRLRFPIE